MKNLIAFVFCLLPLGAACQDLDSVRVAGEVDSLIRVCQGLLDKGKVENSLQKVKEAKETCRARFGEESEKYADCLLAQARIANSIGNREETKSLVLQAKVIKGKVLGTHHPDYAVVLNALGVISTNANEIEKAKNLYLEAKAILEETAGKNHPDYAKILTNLAVAYRESGEYEKSLTTNFEVLDIKERTIGKENPSYAMSLNNIGNTYRDIGNYDLALANVLASKSIIENSIGKTNSDYTRTLRSLNIIYQYKRDIDNALITIKEILSISEGISGKEHPDYIKALSDLAELYRLSGDIDKSIFTGTEAKDLVIKVFGLEHPQYAVILNNLSSCYRQKGDTKKSLQLNLESLEITEKVFGKSNIEYASTLINVGNAYYSEGNSKKAEALYLEALATLKEAVGKNNINYSWGVFNVVKIYREADKYDKAIPLLLEVLVILEKIFGKEHADFAFAQELLSVLYSENGSFQLATSSFLSSNNATKSLLQRSAAYSTETEMFHFKTTLEERFNNLMHFTQSHPTDSLCYATYDNTLFLNNAQLFNAVAREKGIAQADSSTRAIHAEWKSCHFQLGRLYSQPTATRDSSLVAQLEEQANGYEKELVRRSPEFAVAQKEVYWKDVQSQLQSGEAAIEFVNYSWHDRKQNTDTTMYAALVLLPGAAQPQLFPLFEEKQLDSLLLTQSERRADYVNGLYTIAERGLKPKGQPQKSLYELLWQPLEKQLSGIQTVYFSPSGLLHRLNLGAIPVSDETTLADRYRLVEMGSTRQLVVNTEQQWTSGGGQTAVLFGGVQYEMDSTAIAAANASINANLLASRSRSLDGGALSFSQADTSLRGGTWNYLKWTEKEVAAIEPILKNSGIQYRLASGYIATEESFKAIGTAGQPSPRILHIATHGFFYPDPKSRAEGRGKGDEEPVFKTSEHPMIRSGLLLAGANHAWKTGSPLRPDLEDGILTAYEISQMNLPNTELVVLSACETGLGDIQGSEGVFGLQRAFKIAGARYLVMSLWQVPDQETSVFMTQFYRRWLEDKMAIPDAFRATQKEMRERFINPYQWAGFVLVE